MILPDVFFYQLDNANLREYLLTNCKIEKVINLGNVFESVVRPSCVITLQNTPQNGGFQVLDISNLDKPKKSEMINNHDAYLVISLNGYPGSLTICSLHLIQPIICYGKNLRDSHIKP